MHIVKRMIDSNQIVQEVNIHFKKGSWVSKTQKHAVEATIPIRPDSDKNYILGGTWSDGVSVINEETQESFDIWKPIPMPENCLWNQNFTRLTL